MNEDLELLLFDLAAIHASVHKSAREVCLERGITLRVLDLSEDEDLAAQYQIRHFPQCLLLRKGELIDESHVVIHTPASFSKWLDRALQEEECRESNSGV